MQCITYIFVCVRVCVCLRHSLTSACHPILFFLDSIRHQIVLAPRRSYLVFKIEKQTESKQEKRETALHKMHGSAIALAWCKSNEEEIMQEKNSTKHKLNEFMQQPSRFCIGALCTDTNTLFIDMNQPENEVQRNNRQYHLSIFPNYVLYIFICLVGIVFSFVFVLNESELLRRDEKKGKKRWIGNNKQEWNDINVYSKWWKM